MAVYPKQLQLFAESTPFRTGYGSNQILTGAESGPFTVNQIIRFIQEDYYSYITAIDLTSHEPRFRPFDTSFGDVVVFAGAVGSPQAANELIEIMRVLWDIDRAVTNNSIGYATSTQN